VDTDDGSKIVAHVFGDNTDAVTQRLGSTSGEQSLMSRLLPMIAPFVMAWLSKKLGGAVGGQAESGVSSGGGGLGDLLGGLLGVEVAVLEVALASVTCSGVCSAEVEVATPEVNPTSARHQRHLRWPGRWRWRRRGHARYLRSARRGLVAPDQDQILPS
jgi:hypothetical protein